MLFPRTAVKLGLILALALLACTCANAVVIAERTSDLIGFDNVNKLTVYALVTQDNSGLYTYSYSVKYVEGAADVHIFAVDNPNDAPFTGAWNTALFVNPTYAPGLDFPAMIQWDGDATNVLTLGQTKEFGYKSIYAPQDILVYCFAQDGGASADGWTLGMGTAVPEPGSILALACGILGIAPRVIRRRK